MQSGPHLLIDFDSTIVTVESLDLLAEISLGRHPERAARLESIARLTDQAMNGEIGFAEALKQRLGLLPLNRAHIAELVEALRDRISPSFIRNREFFEREGGRVHVLTGGFHEYVDPIVAELGISADRVLANRLIFDGDRVAGIDEASPLSQDRGKVLAVRALGLHGEIVMVGDGWTDAEVRAAGAADRFYAFAETVSRPRVVASADRIVSSFDEVLHREGLARRWSYPRSRMKVLLLENIHPDAADRFRDQGYEVETETRALDEAELTERLPGVSVLGIRSKTQVTARALAGANRLLSLGAYCIGVNQIDLKACSERGMAVFNAPYSNTRSVVELAIGEIIVLVRRLFDKSVAAHAGHWDKSAAGAHELRGQTLGIVGYGAIGSQLSVLAEAMGLTVLYYDVAEKLALGNARRCRTLAELLSASDIVSLHVDGRPQNRNLIGPLELGQMKPGALLLNLSRGHVVDLPALAAALKSGHVAGAGLDVFPEEPQANGQPFKSELQGLRNVILTPHIGGSTEEAQAAIAEFATERLLSFLHRGETTFSVNLPNVQLSEVGGAHRFLHIHRNRPGVLAALNQVLAQGGLNILAQQLNTNAEIGYVVADVDRNYGDEALAALKAVPETLRFRAIY